MTKEYLYAHTKSHVISRLETGDLIKFDSDYWPFVSHHGVVVREDDNLYFYHVQTSLLNGNGGGLVREDLKEYAKNYNIISVEKTNLTKDDILSVSNLLKKDKYHFINNNCEHFVQFLKNKKYDSPQVNRWLVGVSLAVIAYIVIKRYDSK
jgi:hypothetical protein